MKAVVVLLVLLTFVGCGVPFVTQQTTIEADEPPPPTPVITAPTLKDMFPELATLPQAPALFIQDDWLGNGASRSAHYTLNRQADQFVGQAVVQDTSGVSLTRAIAIPIDITENFLRELMLLPVVEGKYEPRQNRTDDYPSVGIRVPTTGGDITFYSTSQSEQFGAGIGYARAPWGITYTERTFVVNTNQIDLALATLQPYFERESPTDPLPTPTVMLPPDVIPTLPPVLDKGGGTEMPVTVEDCDTDGGYEVTNYVAANPTQPEAHIIGVYEARSDQNVENQAMETATVDVLRTGRPLILVLSSYEPVLWRIQLAPGVQLTQIILNGYHPQAVEGMGDTQVLNLSGHERSLGVYPYAYQPVTSTVATTTAGLNDKARDAHVLAAAIEGLMEVQTTSFTGCYRASVFMMK